MVEKKIDMGDNVVKLAWLVDTDSNKPELMKIGHNNQSMTFIPDGTLELCRESNFTFCQH